MPTKAIESIWAYALGMELGSIKKENQAGNIEGSLSFALKSLKRTRTMNKMAEAARRKYLGRWLDNASSICDFTEKERLLAVYPTD